MFAHARPAIFLLAIFILLAGIAYPLALLVIGQVIAPSAANGTLITRDGKIVCSALIGQSWASGEYFHGRPSAAGSGYDASASSGSNLGPTSAKLIDRITADISRLEREGLSAPLPVDAMTASGSGLDPDISPDYAILQVPRVANARGLAEEKVQAVVEQLTVKPIAGMLGEPRVNVLLLNLALDGLSSPGNDG
jgi:K+-transporting ATPase ATPase C chain